MIDRQGSQQQAIDQGENSRVRANTERQSKYQNGRCRARLPKHAESEAHVLSEPFECTQTARLAALFSRALNAAKQQSRLASGFPFIKRVGTVLSRLHFQMELQFFIQLLVHFTTGEQST